MDRIVVAYALYLLISIPLTVLVARTLSRHGRTFLTEVFADSPGLANAVNQLLVVGFYLVSLGFVTLFLTSHAEVPTAREVFELLSVKVGVVALILGAMHLANVLIFNAIRRHHLAPEEAPRPAPLPYGMPQVPPFPRPDVADANVPHVAKSEETRSLIVTTAMRLFTENGYDRTTMRAIAAGAGVSVGNAYYYFSSKEQLIQGFYDEIARQHLDAARARIGGETAFAARLKTVLLCWLDIAEPYQRFGTQFFVNAADPESPLSPFSDDSSAARAASIGLMREVVDGSDVKLDPELRGQLPELLWLYQMGVVLFWVHDRSAGQKRSRMLVERSVPLIARLAALSRLRVFRPVSREIVDLIQDLAKKD